jgi:GGDEF domain-containing protein
VHGHDAGDRVLCEVADRLRLCVRAEDTVGRLGADEFVVLAEDLHAARDALVIAERIVAALDEPMPVGRPKSEPNSGPGGGPRSGPGSGAGNRVKSGAGSRATARATASVGIALSHSGTAGPDDLFRAAGTAMHEAKRRGGGHQLHGATPVPALRSSV